MYYNQSCVGSNAIAHEAAKGVYPGSRSQHQLIRFMQRAAVNIFKTENSYEMLVFAPGRIKENFRLNVKGNELTVSYLPPEGFPRPDWVRREYSRGAFERSFTLDETIDAAKITAKYVDGVLQLSLPIIPGKPTSAHEISIS
ncbi:MAG TPA: Hsp20/alpha crystallin family protein [Chitinophagaceae bacterium]|nr:Hsp20/alpha crystallin family protein [Chitinophagaceae bacterium]